MVSRKTFGLSVLGVLLLGLAPACGDDDGSGAICGNGKLGAGEQCDCGEDASDLPPGCPAPNGAVGANCTAECRRVPVENCANELDDDGDELTDCDDPACQDYPSCLPEICNDSIDNNGDGFTDCDDPTCTGSVSCRTEDCANGIDDNEDGKTDCQDASCVGSAACPDVELCWNGIDDNGDGYADCDDETCAEDPLCSAEICDNGLDDDGDYKVDCADRGCIEKPACAGTDCTGGQLNASVDLPRRGSVGTVIADVAAQGNAQSGACEITGGRDFVVAVTVGESGRLRLVYQQDGDHKFGLYFKGGAGTACTAALNQCAYPGIDTSGVLEYDVLPASTYFVVVAEGSAGNAGRVDLTFTLAEPVGQTELCNNALDDDLNGQEDCGDIACYARPGMCEQTCPAPGDLPVADESLGTLVFGPSGEPAFVHLEEIDTRGEGNDVYASCMPIGWGDYLLHFALDATALLQVGFRQDMDQSGDHVLALFFPGAGCDLAEHRCVDGLGAAEGLVSFPGDPALGGKYPPGDYYLLVKAATGRAGLIALDVIAMADATEVCDDDGYDNDGDGRVNCTDPDCFLKHYCIPEDCTSPTADVDGDGKAGCADDDPDDLCQCSYHCDGRSSCDYAGDPEITCLGLLDWDDQQAFEVDTTGKDTDYELTGCSLAPDAPDLVLYFQLVRPANVQLDYDPDDASGMHVGAWYRVDPCAPCANPNASDYLACYALGTRSGSWIATWLEAGDYAIVLKPRLGPPGGRFKGKLRVVTP